MNHPLTSRAALPSPAREPQPAEPAGAGGPDEPRPAKREPKLSQADILLHLCMDQYQLVRHDQTAYAVPVDGPPIARPLRAKGGFGGTGSLRQLLNRAYVLRTGRSPSQGCLTDAIASMDALALDAEEQPVCLRIAPDPADDQATWLDLGRSDGRSVLIEPGTWSVTTPPIGEGPLWRRTRLTGELPLPERDPGGWQAGLGLLRELSALAEPSWRMAVAWLLAGLRPDMPRPIAYFNGERGTAKTTSARQLLRVLDGIRAEVRNVPRSEDDGAVAASAGWTMGLDNLAGIPQWLSDFLCRAVTGASVAKREVYTDDDVTSWAYQRPVLLTGIDVGALQPDLAERLLPFTLDAIDPKARRSEHDLWRSYRAAHGRILGGLLDLAAAVWARLPDAADQLDQKPRMADWAELLWALDAVTGWDTLSTYTGSQDAITDDVIDADPVATALTRWSSTAGSTEWRATTGQIDEVLRPPGPIPETWPKTTALLSARLTSLAHRPCANAASTSASCPARASPAASSSPSTPPPDRWPELPATARPSTSPHSVTEPAAAGACGPSACPGGGGRPVRTDRRHPLGCWPAVPGRRAPGWAHVDGRRGAGGRPRSAGGDAKLTLPMTHPAPGLHGNDLGFSPSASDPMTL